MNLDEKIKIFLLKLTYAQKLSVVLFCTFLSFLFIVGGLWYSSHALYEQILEDELSFPFQAKMNRLSNLISRYRVEVIHQNEAPENGEEITLEGLISQIDQEIEQFEEMVRNYITKENSRLFRPKIRYHVDEILDFATIWADVKKSSPKSMAKSGNEKMTHLLQTMSRIQKKIRSVFNLYTNDDEGTKRLIDLHFTTLPKVAGELANYFEIASQMPQETSFKNGDLYGISMSFQENLAKIQIQVDGLSGLIDYSLESDTRKFFNDLLINLNEYSTLFLSSGNVTPQIAAYEQIHKALLYLEESQEKINEFLLTLTTKQSASLFFRLYIGYALVFLALFTVLLIYFAKVVLQPLKHLSDAANELAIGKVNIRVPIVKHDEVGEISEAFNALAAFLENTLREVKGVSNGLLEAVQVILEVARQLEKNIAIQDEELHVVKGHIREIAVVVKEFSIHLGNVYKSINATTGFADVGRKSLSEMEHVMKQIVSASQSIVSTLNKLNVKICSINDVINTIVKIADQINLLSLNTAIQANKAGPEGKGFTIIAKKIRELSGQTAYSTLDIEETVREIVTSVDSSTREVNKFLDQVLLQVKDSTLLSDEFKKLIHFFQHQVEVFSSVNEDMAKQAESATDLQDVLKALSNASKRTTISVGQFYREIESLYQSTNSLVEKIDSFTHPSYILLAMGQVTEEPEESTIGKDQGS